MAALLAFVPALFAGDDEIVKDGWNFGPLPCVSYNSDLGFQYGICADIFNYKGVFPDYRDRFYVEASRYTKGQTLLHAQYDSKYLIPGLRTTFSASYQYDPMFLFYGLNGVELYDSSLDVNKETRTARYDYRRSMVRILADVQGGIAPHLNWVAGVSFWKYKIGDLEMDDYDASSTLYHQMVASGVLSPSEATGGSRFEFKAGAVFDTRDNESAPSKGVWAEAYLNASPDIFGDGYKYVRLSAHLRQYLPLAGEKLVFAYHLAYQGSVLGEAPFYNQQNISTLFLRQTCTADCWPSAWWATATPGSIRSCAYACFPSISSIRAGMSPSIRSSTPVWSQGYTKERSSPSSTAVRYPSFVKRPSASIAAQEPEANLS